MWKFRTLPNSLAAALDHMEKGETVREAMGEHVFQHFLLNKHREWDRYIKVIHPWELERYLDRY